MLCSCIWQLSVSQSLLSYCCSVLQSTTYSCCLHSWYKYRVGLPHPAVPKHLPPWCFSSFLPKYSVLIENSGSADIWVEPWYAFCKSPPFLPLLSKKLLTPHMSFHSLCLISNREHEALLNMSWSHGVTFERLCRCFGHDFMRHEIQNAASGFEFRSIFFLCGFLRELLASLCVMMSSRSAGHTESVNMCIKSISQFCLRSDLTEIKGWYDFWCLFAAISAKGFEVPSMLSTQSLAVSLPHVVYLTPLS